MKLGSIISGAATGFVASGFNPWGAVVGGVGGLLAGNAADKADNATRASAAQQKTQFEKVAKGVELQGKMDSAFKMEELNSMISNVNASVAASGISFSSGSAENARLMARREVGRQLGMIKINTKTRADSARATGAAGVSQANANISAANAGRTANMLTGLGAAAIGQMGSSK